MGVNDDLWSLLELLLSLCFINAKLALVHLIKEQKMVVLNNIQPLQPNNYN